MGEQEGSKQIYKIIMQCIENVRTLLTRVRKLYVFINEW